MGDVDTLLVKETLNKSEEREAFIVSSMDADMFVFLLNHFSREFPKDIVMVTKKSNQLINEIPNRISLK